MKSYIAMGLVGCITVTHLVGCGNNNGLKANEISHQVESPISLKVTPINTKTVQTRESEKPYRIALQNAVTFYDAN